MPRKRPSTKTDTVARDIKEKRKNNWSSTKPQGKKSNPNYPIFSNAPIYRPPVPATIVKRETIRIVFPFDPVEVLITSEMVLKALRERGLNPASVALTRVTAYSPMSAHGEIPKAVTITHVPTGMMQMFEPAFGQQYAGGMVRLPKNLVRFILAEAPEPYVIFSLSNVSDITLDVTITLNGPPPLACDLTSFAPLTS